MLSQLPPVLAKKYQKSPWAVGAWAYTSVAPFPARPTSVKPASLKASRKTRVANSGRIDGGAQAGGALKRSHRAGVIALFAALAARRGSRERRNK